MFDESTRQWIRDYKSKKNAVLAAAKVLLDAAECSSREELDKAANILLYISTRSDNPNRAALAEELAKALHSTPEGR